MGNCISSVRRRRQPKKSLTLALLGIDNAGKTTASFSFAGEPIDLDVAPTIGFRSVKFTFDNYNITLFDIGGGKNFRPVWKNYFPEAYGFIYVVDSTSVDRIDEVRETFRESLEHPYVSGKPVLLIANKQDKPEAMDEVDICEQLNLETVVNNNQCPCRIDTCIATQGSGKKMDSHMKEGLRWLLSTVEKHWDKLKARVESDMEVVKKIRQEEAAARQERVRKQREERERQEEEERQKLGIEKKESDEEYFGDGDPFKPLDLAELTKKEETLKAEKKHFKELVKNQEVNGGTVFTPNPSSSVLHTSTQQGILSNDAVDGEDLFFRKSLPSTLPRLEPLNASFLEERGDLKRKKKKKKKLLQNSESSTQLTGQSLDDAARGLDSFSFTPRSQSSELDSCAKESLRTVSGIQVSTHDDFPSRQMLAAGISRVPQPLDSGDRVDDADVLKIRKVKKKKLRHHLKASHNGHAYKASSEDKMETVLRLQPQLKPLDGGDIEVLDRNSTRNEKKGQQGIGDEEKFELSPHSILNKVAPAPAEKPMSMLSRHSQMHSNISLQSDHPSSRIWGLAEDLPTVADDSVSSRHPNFTDEDDIIL